MADTTPVQTHFTGSTLTGNGDFNMGTRFKANTAGSVTKLWARVRTTGDRTIRLFNDAGTELVSATVAGVDNTWVSVDISPVSLTVGDYYWVAYRAGASGYRYFTGAQAVAFTQGDITCSYSGYRSASDLVPNSTSTDPWFGVADITFSPGSSSAVKSVNGLAKASVKSKNGLAIASIKSFNGLA
jgi:hypothetical protein